MVGILPVYCEIAYCPLPERPIGRSIANWAIIETRSLASANRNQKIADEEQKFGGSGSLLFWNWVIWVVAAWIELAAVEPPVHSSCLRWVGWQEQEQQEEQEEQQEQEKQEEQEQAVATLNSHLFAGAASPAALLQDGCPGVWSV